MVEMRITYANSCLGGRLNIRCARSVGYATESTESGSKKLHVNALHELGLVNILCHAGTVRVPDSEGGCFTRDR